VTVTRVKRQRKPGTRERFRLSAKLPRRTVSVDYGPLARKKEGSSMPVSLGTESARPFLPSSDSAVSKSFYEKIGFRKLLDGDVAIFEAGTSCFIVQNYFQKDWAENFMMQLMVDDLDAWWQHIESLDLPATFGVKSPRPPVMQPWGLRVAYVYDPTGVLWHFAERRKGNTADA
jgi:hypothetical protein